MRTFLEFCGELGSQLGILLVSSSRSGVTTFFFFFFLNPESIFIGTDSFERKLSTQFALIHMIIVLDQVNKFPIIISKVG